MVLVPSVLETLPMAQVIGDPKVGANLLLGLCYRVRKERKSKRQSGGMRSRDLGPSVTF